MALLFAVRRVAECPLWQQYTERLDTNSPGKLYVMPLTDDTKLQAALIAAVCSIVVGAIGLVAAIIAARSSAKTARATEWMRRVAEEDKARSLVTDEHLRRALDALAHSLTAIQFLKDKIQFILATGRSTFHAESLLERLIEAQERLSTAYEDAYPYLENEEAEMLHGAKGLGINILQYASEQLHTSPPPSELSDGFRSYLRQARSGLSDIQGRLRDCIDRRLMERCLR